MVKPSHLVWEFFSIKLNGTKKYAFCKFCKAKYFSNATRMKKHMLNCPRCPEEVKNLLFYQDEQGEYQMKTSQLGSTEYSTKGESSKKRPKLSKPKGQYAHTATAGPSNHFSPLVDTCSMEMKETLDRALARAIYSSGVALSFVENVHVKEFFKLIRPAYEPPLETDLRDRLLDIEFEDVSECVTAKIKDTASTALLIDEWIDANGDSCSNMVITTPTPFFLKCLNTEKISAKCLFSSVQEILQEYDKIHAVCTKSTDANKNMWRLVEKEYPSMTTYGCAVYSINLLADYLLSLNSVKHLVTCSKEIIQFFKDNHICKEVLQNMQIKGEDIDLVMDNSELSSIYKSLRSLLVNKDCLQAAICDENLEGVPRLSTIKHRIQKDFFWETVLNCCYILGPIVDALNILEGEGGCKIAEVFPAYLQIEEAFEKNQDFLTDTEQLGIKKFMSSSKFTLVKNVHLAAYLLHPKFKGEQLIDTQFLEASEYIVKIGTSMSLQKDVVLHELLDFNSKLGFWENEILWEAAQSSSAVAWWKGMCKNRLLSAIAVRILNFPATTSWKPLSETQKQKKLPVSKAEKLLNVRYNLHSMSLSNMKVRTLKEIKTEQLSKSEEEHSNMNNISYEISLPEELFVQQSDSDVEMEMNNSGYNSEENWDEGQDESNSSKSVKIVYEVVK